MKTTTEKLTPEYCVITPQQKQTSLSRHLSDKEYDSQTAAIVGLQFYNINRFLRRIHRSSYSICTSTLARRISSYSNRKNFISTTWLTLI